MTNEERDLIASFIARVGGAPGQGIAGAGSVPGTVAPLPPVDAEADALIAQLFNQYPQARYRITQMAFVQEHALVEAQNRIATLQWQLQQMQQAQQAAPQPGNSPWGGAAAGAAAAQPSRGFFSNLFGGGQPSAPQPQYAAPPPPQYPPNYNPGMFQQQGPGFFGSALRTAAGVAGGVVAADALMSLFSGNHGYGGGGFGGGFGGPMMGGGFAAPVMGGVYEQPGGFASPWGAPAGAVDPYDVGGAPKDPGYSDKFGGPANVDQSAWQPAPDQSGGGGGWTDAANQESGGWQQAPDQSDTGGGWTDASDSGGSGGGWSGGDDGS